MSTKRTPPDMDAPPRKMSLIGQRTASERAVRTIRKCGPAIPLTQPLPHQQPPQPTEPVAQPDAEVEALDAVAKVKKPKKDKKKKSKKKKNKNKKGKGKKDAT